MNSRAALLAIESSCDETAVALVGPQGEVFDQQIHSQIDIHRQYGGVVPEVASRSHFETLDGLVGASLRRRDELGIRITGVAATCGPGLIGPLIVGSAYARGLASGWGLPFIGVHHLRGHLASVLLESAGSASGLSLQQKAAQIFPAFVLLVSGGHTQVLEVGPDLEARQLAQSADDAAGECFDKSAKLMGLAYPGGPAIEALASELRPEDKKTAFEILEKLPRPRSSEGFSFSGLKTAIRLLLEKNESLAATPAFCFAVREAIADTLCRGLERAFDQAPQSPARHLVFCGGVSANRRIRDLLGAWSRQRGLELVLPPLRYCTDNAAMIGAAAWIQKPSLALGEIVARQPL